VVVEKVECCGWRSEVAERSGSDNAVEEGAVQSFLYSPAPRLAKLLSTCAIDVDPACVASGNVTGNWYCWKSCGITSARNRPTISPNRADLAATAMT
jgi:hypothetical protein